MKTGTPPTQQESSDDAEIEMSDAEGEVLAPDEVAELEQAALAEKKQHRQPP